MLFDLSLADHSGTCPLLIRATDYAAWFLLGQHHIEYMLVIFSCLVDSFHPEQGNCCLRASNTPLLSEPQLSFKRVINNHHKEEGDDLWWEATFCLWLCTHLSASAPYQNFFPHWSGASFWKNVKIKAFSTIKKQNEKLEQRFSLLFYIFLWNCYWAPKFLS